MSDEHDNAFSVNEHNHRNRFYSEFFVCNTDIVADVVVFNFLPAILGHMPFDLLQCLVNAEAKNADFFRPVSALQKHALVVSHRLLAWRTPSGPEIQQQHFAFSVLDIYNFARVTEDWSGVPQARQLVANRVLFHLFKII